VRPIIPIEARYSPLSIQSGLGGDKPAQVFSYLPDAFSPLNVITVLVTCATSFPFTVEDVADISADRPPQVHRLRDGPKPVAPHRMEEIDLQVQARKAFSFAQARRVRRTNRGIGDIAENAPVHRPHRIRMPRKIRDDFDRRTALARINQIEPQSPGNGWWILKSRTEIHDCLLTSGIRKPVSFRMRKHSPYSTPVRTPVRFRSDLHLSVRFENEHRSAVADNVISATTIAVAFIS
jgi:hypothetical protein